LLPVPTVEETSSPVLSSLILNEADLLWKWAYSGLAQSRRWAARCDDMLQPWRTRLASWGQRALDGRKQHDHAVYKVCCATALQLSFLPSPFVRFG